MDIADVCTLKKDGGTRICVDMRAANQTINRERLCQPSGHGGKDGVRSRTTESECGVGVRSRSAESEYGVKNSCLKTILLDYVFSTLWQQ